MANNAAAALLCCCTVTPPEGCEDCDPITITWSGSCTYSGICCAIDLGGGVTYALNCSSFTCSHSSKESPPFDDLCARLATRFTDFDAPTVDTSCGADNCNFDPSTAAGCRLRFRLLRDVANDRWWIYVGGSGDVPSLAPNEIGATSWEIRFWAEIDGPCPPASGWTYDEDASTLPIVGTVTCEAPYADTNVGVTTFSVGTVSVST